MERQQSVSARDEATQASVPSPANPADSAVSSREHARRVPPIIAIQLALGFVILASIVHVNIVALRLERGMSEMREDLSRVSAQADERSLGGQGAGQTPDAFSKELLAVVSRLAGVVEGMTTPVPRQKEESLGTGDPATGDGRVEPRFQRSPGPTKEQIQP